MIARTFAASLVMLLALLGLPAWAAPEASAPADDAETAAPAATVFLDIAEVMDGKPGNWHITTYWVRTMLREAGFKVVTRRATVWDQEEDRDALLGEDDPVDADFSVEGRVETTLKDRSVFYEQVVAYIYTTRFSVRVRDLHAVQDDDDDDEGVLLDIVDYEEDWGDGGDERDGVVRKTLDRAGYRLAALAIIQPAVHARIPEDKLETVDSLVERIRSDLGLPGEERAQDQADDGNSDSEDGDR